MSDHPILAVTLAGLLLAVGGSASGGAAGQAVTGLVRDAARRPIGGAWVGLLDSERSLVAATLADADGEFALAAPRPGPYYLSIRQVGWKSLLDGPYDLGRGRTLEVEAVMHPLPFTMDSVLVSVEGRVERLAAVGFYERKRSGFGRFLGREEIEATAGRYLTDALRRLSRVTVVDPRPVLGRPDGLLNPALYVQAGGERCTPTLYLDGMPVAARSGPLRPDDYLSVLDVEAVEVYAGPSEMPPQYSPYGACAVILVWSHHTPRIG